MSYIARTIAPAVLLVMTFAAPANAQGVPGVSPNKCLTGKTKCVDKKVAGLLKCREKCQKDPAKCDAVQTACETKVRDKFDGGTKGVEKSCFEKLEAKNDGPCVTFDDLAAMEAKADAFVVDTVATLEGSPPPGCGNGVVEGMESCDGADLGGASCARLGFAYGALACTLGCGYDVSGCACASGGQAFPATGQTTCWNSGGNVIPCTGTGHDGEIQAGATIAYQDNGDGTITDLNTWLMWEKKSDDGSTHDMSNVYTWDNAFAVHVAGLNSGGGFAGHTDWRVANVKELQSILNYENVNPAVSTAFNNGCTPGCTVLTCSCTAADFYWSSTTLAHSPGGAWLVYFLSGYSGYASKTSTIRVRAVRGGL
jgi:hypothetical protein